MKQKTEKLHKRDYTKGTVLFVYRVVYHVFNYLRRNRQLARRVGAFDKDVKLVLSCILSNLLVEYGTDKD